MKISFYFTLMLFVTHLTTNAQSLSPAIRQTILIRNELTGTPVDATLNWANANAVTREAVGSYNVALEPGAGGVLAISRPGYFDSEVTLDYDAAQASPTQEIMLQPGMPQLHISVYDRETNRELSTTIELFTLAESFTAFSETVEVSPFTIDLDHNQAYVLQVRKAGYFPVRDTIDFSHVFEGRVKTRAIKLVPLKAGSRIPLHNIYFDDGATLTACARLMLAEVTQVLREQPGMVIQVGVYADNAGSEDASLSARRAQAIQAYLIEQGAQPGQLLAKGYGKTLPVATNAPDVNAMLNSRVELRIIRMP